MALATQDELAAYLHTSVSELPSDVDRLLERASELVRHAITRTGVFDDNDDPEPDYTAPLRDATTAQVEYYMNAGEPETDESVTSFSLGDLSVDYGTDGAGRARDDTMAPRAYRFLSRAGLLFRGAMVG